MKDKLQNSTDELAARQYDPSDYQKNDQLSSGLATTHEQVSDAYMEGEIKAVIDDVKGKNIEIPRKGYEE
ncbi:YozQ family protein [Ferdinandcohnia sp. Marseille-Q9671]